MNDEQQPAPVPGPNFAEQMAKVYSSAFNVEKNGNNTSQNYRYATVDDVKAAANKALRAAGLFVSACNFKLVEQTPFHRKDDGTKVPGRAVVSLEMVVSDGVSRAIVLTGFGEGLDSGDKAVYKAMAGAVKYALMTGLLIATGDRDDAEASEPGPDAPAPKPAKETKQEKVEGAALKVAELLHEISLRGTLGDLNKLQSPIHALKGKCLNAELDQLVAAYKARAVELTPKEKTK